MARKSLKASFVGIQQLKATLKKKKWSKTYLAGVVGCSRATISAFFNSKSINYDDFIKACSELGLNWEDIAETETAEEEKDSNINIDVLVQEVRELIKPLIQERCGTMRVLDMTHPIGLNDIYTNVNILERITGRRQLKIEELLQNCTSEDFAHFGLATIKEKRIPALKAVEKYSKLMILGKPGAGKTTFLKYLAMQCIEGKFQADHVPFFVTLKDFAEAENKPGLLKYISDDAFKHFSPKNKILKEQFINYVDEVINHGKALILLDGLDEVRDEDNKRVLKEIRDFSERYLNNHFVTTCRIAAREYTFEKFTEVEVADFDDQQIETFANKWFKNKVVKPENFIKRIKENYRIKELATSPLLLTLLCLAFEESGDFPANRSELYKEGLDALLKKWDAKRGIQRDQIYKKLSVQRKEDLLSKIALATFERGDYFFKQNIAEQYITEYIRNLPGANTEEEALQLDSEEILRSIEHHHGLLVARAKGIYSFSHLTFHEYFTAREFVFVQQSSKEALKSLVNHILEKRWLEVFLLAVGMSPNADILLLLMKNTIDSLISADEKIQNFLNWVNHKSISVECHNKLVAIKAFYFDLALAPPEMHCPDLQFNPILSFGLDSTFIFDAELENLPADLAIDYCFFVNLTLAVNGYLETDFIVPEIPNIDISCYLLEELKILEQKILSILNPEQQEELEDWILKYRKVLIKFRNIGYDWQFTNDDKKLLKQYHDANLTLVRCLNSDCYVSREVRQYIEETLLLPIEEIEKVKAKYPTIFPNSNQH
ncbi:MAG TPA: NACHT domain-containing NTPase [Nostocaceae cyanobacterium]|nr:NACHT domain-containing NTPase [Nostocaceae cyanobacterium]